MANPRPLGVTIVAILFLILGLLWLVTAFMAGITETDSLVYLVLGIIYIVLAFGLFGGWNWVWYLAVILALVSIGAALWGWYLADFTLDALWNAFLAMIIPLIILWYLFRTNVRAFFFGT